MIYIFAIGISKNSKKRPTQYDNKGCFYRIDNDIEINIIIPTIIDKKMKKKSRKNDRHALAST